MNIFNKYSHIRLSVKCPFCGMVLRFKFKPSTEVHSCISEKSGGCQRLFAVRMTNETMEANTISEVVEVFRAEVFELVKVREDVPPPIGSNVVQIRPSFEQQEAAA